MRVLVGRKERDEVVVERGKREGRDKFQENCRDVGCNEVVRQ